MVNYYLTIKEVEDLAEIWDYTSDEWSENQADNYYDILNKTFNEIARNPELGRNYEGIAPLLFGIKVTKHIIFYRKINKNELEITRILHERMELKSRYQD